MLIDFDEFYMKLEEFEKLIKKYWQAYLIMI